MAEQRQLSEAGKLLTTYAILGALIHPRQAPVTDSRITESRSTHRRRKHPRARALRKKYGERE